MRTYVRNDLSTDGRIYFLFRIDLTVHKPIYSATKMNNYRYICLLHLAALFHVRMWISWFLCILHALFLLDCFIIDHHPRNQISSFLLFFSFAANENGNALSPLHDIPLHADDSQKVYNMVVEVPRWTNAKMEVCWCNDYHLCAILYEAHRFKCSSFKLNYWFLADCVPLMFERLINGYTILWCDYEVWSGVQFIVYSANTVLYFCSQLIVHFVKRQNERYNKRATCYVHYYSNVFSPKWSFSI